MTNKKPWYKSKEIALIAIGIYNMVAMAFGSLPHVDPTPELIAAYLGVIAAVRLFFTETKLSLK